MRSKGSRTVGVAQEAADDIMYIPEKVRMGLDYAEWFALVAHAAGLRQITLAGHPRTESPGATSWMTHELGPTTAREPISVLGIIVAFEPSDAYLPILHSPLIFAPGLT